jgi:hypothetical protein
VLGVFGFGWSFTALSPLVIGGVIGFSSMVACAATVFILESLGIIRKHKEAPKLKQTIGMIILPIITTAVGVVLGAAVNPAIMLNMWTAALAGAAIGMLGIMLSGLAAVDIIEPVVEKVTQCFSNEAYI